MSDHVETGASQDSFSQLARIDEQQLIDAARGIEGHDYVFWGKDDRGEPKALLTWAGKKLAMQLEPGIDLSLEDCKDLGDSWLFVCKATSKVSGNSMLGVNVSPKRVRSRETGEIVDDPSAASKALSLAESAAVGHVLSPTVVLRVITEFGGNRPTNPMQPAPAGAAALAPLDAKALKAIACPACSAAGTLVRNRRGVVYCRRQPRRKVGCGARIAEGLIGRPALAVVSGEAEQVTEPSPETALATPFQVDALRTLLARAGISDEPNIARVLGEILGIEGGLGLESVASAQVPDLMAGIDRMRRRDLPKSA